MTTQIEIDNIATVGTDVCTMLPSEYIDTLRPMIVRLETRWIADTGRPDGGYGTGIVVDKAPRDRPVEWTLLQQHDSTGDRHRTIRFTAGPGAKQPRRYPAVV